MRDYDSVFSACSNVRAMVYPIASYPIASYPFIPHQEITRAIYTTHPEHLVLAAIGNTAQALRVLQNDGIVDPTTKSNEDSMAIGTAKWCVVSRM